MHCCAQMAQSAEAFQTKPTTYHDTAAASDGHCSCSSNKGTHNRNYLADKHDLRARGNNLHVLAATAATRNGVFGADSAGRRGAEAAAAAGVGSSDSGLCGLMRQMLVHNMIDCSRDSGRKFQPSRKARGGEVREHNHNASLTRLNPQTCQNLRVELNFCRLRLFGT